MRDFLYNKKKSHLLALFSHYRMAATIAKANMAIKATTPPATITNVSFFIFFSFFRFFVYLTQDSRKKQQKGARLTPGSKFLRHVS